MPLETVQLGKRKCLYEKSNKPDNWTDEYFLVELRKNQNVIKHKYLDLVLQTALITQHVCLLSFFCSVFHLTYTKKLSSYSLLVGDACILLAVVVGARICRIATWPFLGKVVVFALILAGLSPILKTLTEDTSSDTIWALSSILFLINCTFQSYGQPE